MSKRLALIIGNEEFDDPDLSRLASPLKDTFDFSRVLRKENIGGFDEVVVVANETVHQLNLIIADFYANKEKDDLLVLYYSGHGILDNKGKLFLAAKDTNRNMLRATAVNAFSLVEEINDSPSKRKVVILDCCHSGAFASGSKGVIKEKVGTGSIFEGDGYGRVVLTASDSIEFAFDGGKIVGLARNSIFTRFLIEGLEYGAADIDSDGQITLDELYDYVFEKVRQTTSLQTPQKWAYRQEGRIIIARNPSYSIDIFDLPPDLLSALKSPFVDLRIGAANVLGNMLNDPKTYKVAHTSLLHLCKDQVSQVANVAIHLLGDELNEKMSETQTSYTQSTMKDVICLNCHSLRETDMSIPCPVCGSQKYLTGYYYQHEIQSIKKVAFLAIVFLVMITGLTIALYSTFFLK